MAVPSVYAQYTSPGYQVEELMFGTGGDVDQSSPNFQAQSSAGSLGVGEFSSPNFDGYAGLVTPNEPYLAMEVTGATVDLGELNTGSANSGAAQAGSCSCSFTIRTYLSSEYVVMTMSQPPTNNEGYSLTAKSTQGVPSTNASVEEFGINLVDNATPNIGANPANQPDNTFADGEAASGYEIADQFKYGVGDIIARSAATAGNQAVGLTYYTISYIAKSKLTTPSGAYTMGHDIVVVATY